MDDLIAEKYRMYDRYFDAINRITKYRDTVLYFPNNYNREDFKRRSWKRSAIDELLRRLQVNFNSGVYPYDLIEYYWRELNDCYEMSKSEDARNMFDAMKCAVFDVGLAFV